jgi:hypothetical protein
MEQALKSPRFVAIFLYLFLGLYWLTLFFEWHKTFLWFDGLLHFLGGVWLAAFFGYALIRFDLAFVDRRFWVKLILGLGFVALVGVLWELHEFAADLYLKDKAFMQPDLQDTMFDLALDLLGGFIFFILCRIAQKPLS